MKLILEPLQWVLSSCSCGWMFELHCVGWCLCRFWHFKAVFTFIVQSVSIFTKYNICIFMNFYEGEGVGAIKFGNYTYVRLQVDCQNRCWQCAFMQTTTSRANNTKLTWLYAHIWTNQWFAEMFTANILLRGNRCTLVNVWNTGIRYLPVKIQRVPIVKRIERGNHHAVAFRDLWWNVFCVSDRRIMLRNTVWSRRKRLQNTSNRPCSPFFFLWVGMKTDFLGWGFRRKEHWNPACWGRMQHSERDFQPTV